MSEVTGKQSKKKNERPIYPFKVERKILPVGGKLLAAPDRSHPQEVKQDLERFGRRLSGHRRFLNIGEVYCVTLMAVLYPI
jgi:hypothetical protein